MRRSISRWVFAALGAFSLIIGNTPQVFAAADPNKILHVAIEAGDDGFDPSRSTNYYSGLIEEVMFERLLTYDYLAEPVKLVPMLAEAMPEVTNGGKTYTFHLRKGIYFTPDPAFKGKRRELIADDVIYSIKRFMDPRNRSPWRWLFDGKIVGLNEQEALAKKNGDRFDYDAKLAGLEAVDRYTVRVNLTDTDYNFSFILASPTTSIVAREVIEQYSDDTKGHPVGTGPYMLSEWQRGTRILLHANPDYRGFTWDFAPIGESLGQGCRRRDEGQTDAPDRRHRRSLARGGTVALARLPGRRNRLHRPLRLVFADGDSRTTRWPPISPKKAFNSIVISNPR